MNDNMVGWLRAIVEIVTHGNGDRLIALIQDFEQDHKNIIIRCIDIKELKEVEDVSKVQDLWYVYLL